MQNRIFKMARLTVLIVLLVMLCTIMAEAQCPMCRMSAETNLEEGGTVAAGLNKGIIYLLTIPYILVGTIGYLWWRNRRLVQEQDQEEEIRSLLEPHDVVISKTEFNESVKS